MATLFPSLAHLQPPSSCAPLRLDRFSPLYAQPAEFGFAKVRPARAYYFVYPFGRRELAELAYFFDFDYARRPRPAGYLGPVPPRVERGRPLATATGSGRVSTLMLDDDGA